MRSVLSCSLRNISATSRRAGSPSVPACGAVVGESESQVLATAMHKLRIVTQRFGTRRQRKVLDDGQIPHFRAVRVHSSTGYNRSEANWWASRNGLVSDLPPEILNVAIHNFFFIAARCTRTWQQAPCGRREVGEVDVHRAWRAHLWPVGTIKVHL